MVLADYHHGANHVAQCKHPRPAHTRNMTVNEFNKMYILYNKENKKKNIERTCFGEGNIVITISLVSETSKGDSFVRIPFSENNFMTLGLLVDRKTESKHLWSTHSFANKLPKDKLDHGTTRYNQ